MKLEDILKEAGLLDKIAFAGEYNKRFIAKLQGAKPGSEENNYYEQNLYQDIINWLNNADTDISKHQNKINTLAKQYPIIFKPITPIGTPLYRGLEDINNKIIKELRNSSINDWVKMKDYFWFYKKPIIYKPRKKIQSWTDKLNVAKSFSGDGILITKQTKEFYFNKKVLAAMFEDEEHEVIHFGNTYTSPVYIAIEEEAFDDGIKDYLFKKDKNLTFKSIGSQIVSKKKK